MEPFLIFAVLLIAIVYGAVGHGGASGYIAVMALAGLAPEVIRPTALLLNVVVSLCATVMFGIAGLVRWKTLPWLAIGSMPAAWLGGSLHLSDPVFRWMLAITLVWAAWRLISRPTSPSAGSIKKISPAFITVAAPGIGLVSGLVGVGGGIFLTPLLVLGGRATAREAAALSAPFILLNSLAGLTGLGEKIHHALPSTPWLAAAAAAGGLAGAFWGSRRATPPSLGRMLAAILILAAFKFMIRG